MLPLTGRAFWLTLFLLGALCFINEVRSEGRVVCYYTNWSVYRPGTAKFNPQNINPYLCTHLVYAFGGFTKDNQMKPFDKYQDIEQGGYAKFTGLKTYNKQLKTMIAIGGWNEASTRFSPLVASPDRRQKFVKNILKFLRQNHFDGIDLDWEYPAHREGGKPRDRDNYAQFVQELRTEFEKEAEKTGRPRLLLTMAVPAGIEYIEKGYDIPKLNKYLDWFNVLTYDFHSSHEPSVNHHAPLYSLEEASEYNYDADLNIDYAIKFYIKAGADRDKLVLGIPTYGRSYTLINEESTDLGAPAEGPGEQGDATREKGYLAYYEICQNLKEDPEWKVVHPNPEAMGPYAYRRNQWVGFDDEDIVRKKSRYVVEQGLGGIMFWSVDNDDFRGICSGKPYPLIEAAKEAMIDALRYGINEVGKPSSTKTNQRSRSRENSSSSTRNRITNEETGRRRPQSTTTTTTTTPRTTTVKLTESKGSSLYKGDRTPTPPPPPTPDPGADFKCEEEGFFQHPRDCKKYFWCLDSGPSGLGIVAHMFTCPSGLYFNPAADSCDFARNVPCKIKKSETTSTTSATITSTTSTTTTTSRPQYYQKPTFATSRPSFLRTTRTSTTTTTAAPVEEIEYEDENEAPEKLNTSGGSSSNKEAEEDPQVIKELIELIRKVGGIEELEKHLLRKDDGTISIKESTVAPGASTTPSPISKSIFEKVLSRTNTYNSFRNRFVSSSILRGSGTSTPAESSKPSEDYSEDIEAEEEPVISKKSNSGLQKYSSVVRSNSRQGPQNEGLEKLPDLDGIIKEKKYVTIHRNRGSAKAAAEKSVEDEDPEEIEYEIEDEEEVENDETPVTERPKATATPSYASIRRSKGTTTSATTTTTTTTERAVEQPTTEVKATKKRQRLRTTSTTERPVEKGEEEEAPTSTTKRYFERSKYTRNKPTNGPYRKEIPLNKDDIDKADDVEANEEELIPTVHFEQANVAPQTTPKTTTQQQQRTYSSIGRSRTTTTTTVTPLQPENLVTDVPSPVDTNNNLTNDAIDPLIVTSYTSTTIPPTTANPDINFSTTDSDSPQPPPPLIGVITSTTDLPITETFNNESTESTESLSLSINVNTIEPDFSDAIITGDVVDEQNLKDNERDERIEDIVTTTPTTTTSTTVTTERLTTKTLTTTATTDNESKTATSEEVTKPDTVQRTETLYKSITRTRNRLSNNNIDNTISIDNASDDDTKSEINNSNNNTQSSSNSSSNISNKNLTSSNIGYQKYSSGRRQQLKPTTTTESPSSIPSNQFLGTVSSPRPFGFPRRRPTRPTTTTTTASIPTEETKPTKEFREGVNIAKTRLSPVVNSNKVSSQTIQHSPIVDLVPDISTKYTLAPSPKPTQFKSPLSIKPQAHVVQVVERNIANLDGKGDGSIKHVVNGVGSLKNSVEQTVNFNSKVNMVAGDIDTEQKPQRSYSWRDPRRPTKRPTRQLRSEVDESEPAELEHKSNGQPQRRAEVVKNIQEVEQPSSRKSYRLRSLKMVTDEVESTGTERAQLVLKESEEKSAEERAEEITAEVEPTKEPAKILDKGLNNLGLSLLTRLNYLRGKLSAEVAPAIKNSIKAGDSESNEKQNLTYAEAAKEPVDNTTVVNVEVEEKSSHNVEKDSLLESEAPAEKSVVTTDSSEVGITEVIETEAVESTTINTLEVSKSTTAAFVTAEPILPTRKKTIFKKRISTASPIVDITAESTSPQRAEPDVIESTTQSRPVVSSFTTDYPVTAETTLPTKRKTFFRKKASTALPIIKETDEPPTSDDIKPMTDSSVSADVTLPTKRKIFFRKKLPTVVPDTGATEEPTTTSDSDILESANVSTADELSSTTDSSFTVEPTVITKTYLRKIPSIALSEVEPTEQTSLPDEPSVLLTRRPLFKSSSSGEVHSETQTSKYDGVLDSDKSPTITDTKNLEAVSLHRTSKVYSEHHNQNSIGSNTIKAATVRTRRPYNRPTVNVPQDNEEYEYYNEVISEPPTPSTTPRPVTRNRGSVKFQSNDLSSLLALDFVSKSNRKQEGQKTIVSGRRRIYKKPNTRPEAVENLDVEREEAEISTRPPRPTTANRRTTEETETTSTKVPRTRPTRPLRLHTVENVDVEREEAEISTRPPRPTTANRRTTEETETASTKVPRTRPTRPLRVHSTTTVESDIEIDHADNNNGEHDNHEPNYSDVSLKPPTTFARRPLVRTRPTRPYTSTEPVLSPIADITSSTATPPELTTQRGHGFHSQSIIENNHGDVTTPKTLVTTQKGYSFRTPTGLSTTSTTTETIVEDTDDDSLTVPIYHRRNHYTYYKDSPIYYIGKVAPVPNKVSFVDVKAQIHDVFNISEESNSNKDENANSIIESSKAVNYTRHGNNFLNNTSTVVKDIGIEIKNVINGILESDKTGRYGKNLEESNGVHKVPATTESIFGKTATVKLIALTEDIDKQAVPTEAENANDIAENELLAEITEGDDDESEARTATNQQPGSFGAHATTSIHSAAENTTKNHNLRTAYSEKDSTSSRSESQNQENSHNEADYSGSKLQTALGNQYQAIDQLDQPTTSYNYSRDRYILAKPLERIPLHELTLNSQLKKSFKDATKLLPDTNEKPISSIESIYRIKSRSTTVKPIEASSTEESLTAIDINELALGRSFKNRDQPLSGVSRHSGQPFKPRSTTASPTTKTPLADFTTKQGNEELEAENPDEEVKHATIEQERKVLNSENYRERTVSLSESSREDIAQSSTTVSPTTKTPLADFTTTRPDNVGSASTLDPISSKTTSRDRVRDSFKRRLTTALPLETTTENKARVEKTTDNQTYAEVDEPTNKLTEAEAIIETPVPSSNHEELTADITETRAEVPVHEEVQLGTEAPETLEVTEKNKLHTNAESQILEIPLKKTDLTAANTEKLEADTGEEQAATEILEVLSISEQNRLNGQKKVQVLETSDEKTDITDTKIEENEASTEATVPVHEQILSATSKPEIAKDPQEKKHEIKEETRVLETSNEKVILTDAEIETMEAETEETPLITEIPTVIDIPKEEKLNANENNRILETTNEETKSNARTEDLTLAEIAAKVPEENGLKYYDNELEAEMDLEVVTSLAEILAENNKTEQSNKDVDAETEQPRSTSTTAAASVIKKTPSSTSNYLEETANEAVTQSPIENEEELVTDTADIQTGQAILDEQSTTVRSSGRRTRPTTKIAAETTTAGAATSTAAIKTSYNRHYLPRGEVTALKPVEHMEEVAFTENQDISTSTKSNVSLLLVPPTLTPNRTRGGFRPRQITTATPSEASTRIYNNRNRLTTTSVPVINETKTQRVGSRFAIRTTTTRPIEVHIDEDKNITSEDSVVGENLIADIVNGEAAEKQNNTKKYNSLTRVRTGTRTESHISILDSRGRDGLTQNRTTDPAVKNQSSSTEKPLEKIPIKEIQATTVDTEDIEETTIAEGLISDELQENVTVSEILTPVVANKTKDDDTVGDDLESNLDTGNKEEATIKKNSATKEEKDVDEGLSTISPTTAKNVSAVDAVGAVGAVIMESTSKEEAKHDEEENSTEHSIENEIETNEVDLVAEITDTAEEVEEEVDDTGKELEKEAETPTSNKLKDDDMISSTTDAISLSKTYADSVTRTTSRVAITKSGKERFTTVEPLDETSNEVVTNVPVHEADEELEADIIDEDSIAEIHTVTTHLNDANKVQSTDLPETSTSREHVVRGRYFTRKPLSSSQVKDEDENSEQSTEPTTTSSRSYRVRGRYSTVRTTQSSVDTAEIEDNGENEAAVEFVRDPDNESRARIYGTTKLRRVESTNRPRISTLRNYVVRNRYTPEPIISEKQNAEGNEYIDDSEKSVDTTTARNYRPRGRYTTQRTAATLQTEDDEEQQTELSVVLATTRRTYVIRSRPTTRVNVSDEQETNDSEDSNSQSLSSTTRRNYLSRNRFTTSMPLVTESVEILDIAEPAIKAAPTARTYRPRVRYTTTAPILDSNEDDNDDDIAKPATKAAPTARTYRPRVRYTTTTPVLDSNEDDNDDEETEENDDESGKSLDTTTARNYRLRGRFTTPQSVTTEGPKVHNDLDSSVEDSNASEQDNDEENKPINRQNKFYASLTNLRNRQRLNFQNNQENLTLTDTTSTRIYSKYNNRNKIGASLNTNDHNDTATYNPLLRLLQNRNSTNSINRSSSTFIKTQTSQQVNNDDNIENANNENDKNVDDDDDDDDYNRNIDKAVSDNDGNNKRRFQKYQFNRTRSRPTTTTTTTAKTTLDNEEDVNQVNSTSSDDDHDEENNATEQPETTSTSPSPGPTARRIRVLKYRRPINGDANQYANNSNSNSLIAKYNILNGRNSSNLESSTTNITNIVTDNNLNINSTVVEPVEIIENNNLETISTTPTKRYRKIIRKLIRPVNRTVIQQETTATDAPITANTVTLDGSSKQQETTVRDRSKYGRGRSRFFGTGESTTGRSRLTEFRRGRPTRPSTTTVTSEVEKTLANTEDGELFTENNEDDEEEGVDGSGYAADKKEVAKTVANTTETVENRFSRKYSRRPTLPNTRPTAAVAEEGEVESEQPASTVRPALRKKLIARRPYVPPSSKPVLTVSATTETVITSPRTRPQFVARKLNRFNVKPKETLDAEKTELEDEDYDDRTVEETDKTREEPAIRQQVLNNLSAARVPQVPKLLNRPKVTTSDEVKTKDGQEPTAAEESVDDNEDEEEGDEEEEEIEAENDEDESEEEKDTSPNFTDDDSASKATTTPTTKRTKLNRILPGSRPSFTPNAAAGNALVNARGQKYNTPARTRYGQSRTTSRPRVINRPPGVAVPNLTIKPVAQDFVPTTLPTDTKPAPFIPTNTRSYERKYIGTSTTEAPETIVDNPLIEDLNIEALNARNKKIFDINSKKHTTLKPKLQIPPLTKQEHEKNIVLENDDADNTATNAGVSNTNTDVDSSSGSVRTVVNEISSQDQQQGRTEPPPPATTLTHVFTLKEEEQWTTGPPTVGNHPILRLLTDRVQPKHKVVEINRIVEITSKEDKLRRKSKANKEFLTPIGSSNLKVESLPHLEQLGEISVVKYVHLVDGSEIKIDSHSTVADYTPTEATQSKTSDPFRNALPQEFAQLNGRETEDPNDQATSQTRHGGNALLAETPEGERKGKALDVDEKLETANVHIKYIMPTAGEPLTTESLAAAQSTATESNTQAASVPVTLFPTYVRPIVPLLRPESNESSPLVISIANLDKVILSKVSTKPTETPTETNTVTPEYTPESSTAHIESKHSTTTEIESTVLSAADSNTAYSSRYSMSVEAPSNVLTNEAHATSGLLAAQKLEIGNNVENIMSTQNIINTLNNQNIVNGSSSISEIVSYSSETNVVHKKSKNKKSRKSHFKNIQQIPTTPRAVA